MASDSKTDPTITPLTGSSAPGAGDAGFEPVASEPAIEVAYRCLKRPMFRDTSERLAELCAEHRRLVDFYDVVFTAEDNHDHLNEKLRTGHSDGTDHAIRMLQECENLIEAIPARSLRDLGLKARVLSWSRGQWWDERHTGEPGARNLIDDILNLAGVDRVRRMDVSFTELLPSYAGSPHHLREPRADETSGPQFAPTTELERLSQDYVAAIGRHNAYDRAAAMERQGVRYDRLDRARAEELERISTIEAHASYLQAQTLTDALFQVLLLHGEAEALYSWVDPSPEASGSIPADTLARRIERHLYSIRGVLERVSGVKGSDLNADYGMRSTPGSLEPSADLEMTPTSDRQVAA